MGFQQEKNDFVLEKNLFFSCVIIPSTLQSLLNIYVWKILTKKNRKILIVRVGVGVTFFLLRLHKIATTVMST
jgi:hypothetical protein